MVGVNSHSDFMSIKAVANGLISQVIDNRMAYRSIILVYGEVLAGPLFLN